MCNRSRRESRCCHENIYAIRPSLSGKKLLVALQGVILVLFALQVKPFFPTCPINWGRGEKDRKPQADRKGEGAVVAKETSLKVNWGRRVLFMVNTPSLLSEALSPG